MEVSPQRANDLRAYIAAAVERAANSGQPTDTPPELREWQIWAHELADRHDPVSSTLDRLLGDPQMHSATVGPHAATAS